MNTVIFIICFWITQGDRVNLTELTHNSGEITHKQNYRETSRRQFRRSEVDGNGDNRVYK
jgi:hypothetical protein